jgi:coproporphyrinogen III oxidase
VSVVYGSMPPSAYRAATGNAEKMKSAGDAGMVPFFAAGISSVMHPRNPHAPTMHFNYRCVHPQHTAIAADLLLISVTAGC